MYIYYYLTFASFLTKMCVVKDVYHILMILGNKRYLSCGYGNNLSTFVLKFSFYELYYLTPDLIFTIYDLKKNTYLRSQKCKIIGKNFKNLLLHTISKLPTLKNESFLLYKLTYLKIFKLTPSVQYSYIRNRL